jgi:hypothetical protein
MGHNRRHGTAERSRHPGALPTEPIGDEGKLRTAAGQVYPTERMDKINDYDIDHLQLDTMIRQDMGER